MIKRMSLRLRLGSVVALAALLTTGCEQVPLLAPTAATITVSASTAALPTGGTTEVTAFVSESSGTPVQNGTLVRFTSTLGRVDPAEVETRGGLATTTFTASNVAGTAQIRAFSGGATGGTGTTPTNLVEIQIGAANVATVSLSASSSTVPASGGTVTMTATVFDASGNRMGNVPVTFTTTAGTLSTTTATTGENGQTTVQLTTNRTATVTARAGSGETGRTATVTITASTPSSIAISASPTTVNAGQPVTVTVTPTIGSNSSAPRVVLVWGDGSSSDLGSVASTRTATHTYTAGGTYTITATATADGETTSASTQITVNALGPVSTNVSASNSTPARCSPVTFTATASVPPGDTTPIARYEWSIQSDAAEENENVETTGNQLTRVFRTTGTKTVTVTAVTTDGRRGVGQTQIVVRQLVLPEVCN